MPRIHFNAPAHHVLEHEGKVLAHGGGEADVSDELAEQLLAEVPEVSVARSTLTAKSRDELNKLAAEAGVEDPKALSNKNAVIAAIENAPAADAGEGQPTEPATEENES